MIWKKPMMKKTFILISALCFTLLSFGQIKNPKRGISYGYHSEADLQAISGSLSWWYNWANTPETAVADIFENYDMDFVPMTWNASYSLSKLRDFYTKHPEARFLLGFNEPNFRDQANMTPSQAAAAWPGLEAIADEFGLELVGPAVNWCGNCVSEGGITFTNPYDYLDAFFEACVDCRVDYLAVHNYMCYAGPLVDYLEGFRKYGKKIWLTEFACWDQSTITLDMQKNLLIGALDHLDNDSLIYRYSWFTGRSGSTTPHIDLFENEPGKLSELGELYVNYNPVHDTSLFTPVPDRIEAENYSTMSGISLEGTSDFDGIANVGWIDGGDWLEYNLELSDSGSYYLYLRIAATASSSISVLANDSLKSVVDFSSTGGWQKWKTLQSQIDLDSGKVKLRLLTPTGNFNINWLRISSQDNTAPDCTAGEDKEITTPVSTVLLTGLASDADGDSLVYRWSQVSGTACTLETPASHITNISGLAIGSYSFKLEVSDSYVVSSSMVRIRVLDGTIGVNEAQSGELEVYPNPVNDVLMIMIPDIAAGGQLNIMNALGQVVHTHSVTETKGEIHIDLSHLEDGLYFLRLDTPESSYVARLIKTNMPK